MMREIKKGFLEKNGELREEVERFCNERLMEGYKYFYGRL
jgi:hypothetical protein